MPKEIHDLNRAGTLEITDTNWDSNGTLRVTVRELYGHRSWGLPKAKQERAVRDFARQAISHPHLTQSARIVKRWHGQSTDHWTVAVSRNPR